MLPQHNKAEEALYNLTKQRVKYMRPPYGRFDWSALEAMGQIGTKIIIWSGGVWPETPQTVMQSAKWVRQSLCAESLVGVCAQSPWLGSVRRVLGWGLCAESLAGVCAQSPWLGSVRRVPGWGLCTESLAGVCAQSPWLVSHSQRALVPSATRLHHPDPCP
jgi:hypothetical protein